MAKNFDELLSKVSSCSKKKLSVACAQDKAVLEAVKAAKERGIADSILVGDEAKIKEIAATIDMDLSDYEIINVEDTVEASLAAVKLVHDKKADMYLKGLLDTKTFLKSVLNKECGLRTGKPLSHVCVFEIPGIDRLLFFTDVAFIPYPTLEDKVNIINYTVEVANACGVENPKVAPLAAVEIVNPKMPVTVDAQQLTEMNERGEITGCIVDGPLSLDIALYKEAAAEKGALDRKIVGDADILLFPDIHAGNLVYKAIVHMVPVKNGNILTGTQAPVILTSRSDTCETKVNSIALAAVVAEEIRKLADQSKESGNKIHEIVKKIGETADKTTASAREAESMVNEQARALQETVNVFGMIQDCVGELVEGIRLITQRLEESMLEKDKVENSLQNIASVSEEVAASTQEVTATLGEQVSVVQTLKEEVEMLRSDALELDKSIEKFKTD